MPHELFSRSCARNNRIGCRRFERPPLRPIVERRFIRAPMAPMCRASPPLPRIRIQWCPWNPVLASSALVVVDVVVPTACHNESFGHGTGFRFDSWPVAARHKAVLGCCVTACPLALFVLLSMCMGCAFVDWRVEGYKHCPVCLAFAGKSASY